MSSAGKACVPEVENCTLQQRIVKLVETSNGFEAVKLCSCSRSGAFSE